jgi:hypothetical protein
VVILRCIPSSWHMSLQTEEVNCGPLSEVMACDAPNLAIQPVKRACAQLLAVVEDTGMASAQCVERSTIVKRCVWPHRVVGRGPTRSTCENLLPGTSIGWVTARACVVTFPRAQSWQSRHQAVTSLAIPFHTNLLKIRRFEAIIPG